MSQMLEELVGTTFASREAAAAALEAAGGDLPKARKALARKRSTPLSPTLGPRFHALLELAKAAGSRPQKHSTGMDFLAFGLPPDVAFVQFVSLHWNLHEVNLAGARVHGAGITTSDKRLGGGSVMPLELGKLASGEAIVFRYDAQGSTLVAVDESGNARAFTELDGVLAEIEADAVRRGLPNPFTPPAKKTRGHTPGPPPATPGDDHRLYAGADLLDVEFPHVMLYEQPPRILVRLKKKITLPANDLWLVSREGKLYKLAPNKPSRGSVLCFATLQA